MGQNVSEREPDATNERFCRNQSEVPFFIIQTGKDENTLHHSVLMME